MRGVANILNKLKYSSGLANTKIIIISRGHPDNKKEIYGKDVLEIKKDRFVCSIDDEETTIPNHRILEIVIDKQVFWKKRLNR